MLKLWIRLDKRVANVTIMIISVQDEFSSKLSPQDICTDSNTCDLCACPSIINDRIYIYRGLALRS